MLGIARLEWDSAGVSGFVDAGVMRATARITNPRSLPYVMSLGVEFVQA
jgi:hypothetical protein